MKYFGAGISEQHKELSKIIRKATEIERSKTLFLEIHAKLNLSAISNTVQNEVDNLLYDLERTEYAIMPTSKDETIAWVLWHIARIEDLTINVLVARQEQVFNREWQERLNASITDTGNALSDDEIITLSKNLNIDELIRYRNQVATKTRGIINNLNPDEMKRKILPSDLKRVLTLGGVTEQENSIWLLEFWGKKDVAGILLMPPTRHVILHLNDCCRWKEYFRTKKQFYRN